MRQSELSDLEILSIIELAKYIDLDETTHKLAAWEAKKKF